MTVNKPSNPLEETINTVKEVRESYTSVREELASLKESVHSGMSNTLTVLNLQVKSALIPKEVDQFLGEFNPLVEAFSSIQDLLSGNAPGSSPQTLQEIINDKIFGKDITQLLATPTAAVIPLKMEQDKPGFLFRLCMNAPTVQNIEDIPVGATINVRYEGWKQELVNFLDNTATIPQILPDASIIGLKVKLRNSDQEVDYTRSVAGNRYVFKDANGQTLELKHVESMTVTKKDNDKDRRKLWSVLRTAEISQDIEKKLDGEVALEQYVNSNKEQTAEVIQKFKQMPYSEKLSPQGRHNAGCYKTAENLYRRLGNGDLRNANPLEKQDSSSEQYNMLSYIPRLIEEKKLQPGTVFWIKKDPSIHDPTSQNSHAGNHFFTYVGDIKSKDGKEQPYFVDQFGFGNLARMNGSYPKRFFHQAFAPKKSA